MTSHRDPRARPPRARALLLALALLGGPGACSDGKGTYVIPTIPPLPQDEIARDAVVAAVALCNKLDQCGQLTSERLGNKTGTTVDACSVFMAAMLAFVVEGHQVAACVEQTACQSIFRPGTEEVSMAPTNPLAACGAIGTGAAACQSSTTLRTCNARGVCKTVSCPAFCQAFGATGGTCGTIPYTIVTTCSCGGSSPVPDFSLPGDAGVDSTPGDVGTGDALVVDAAVSTD